MSFTAAFDRATEDIRKLTVPLTLDEKRTVYRECLIMTGVLILGQVLSITNKYIGLADIALSFHAALFKIAKGEDIKTAKAPGMFDIYVCANYFCPTFAFYNG